MLDKNQTIMFFVTVGLIGGCALIGFTVSLLTIVAIANGEGEQLTWVPLAILGTFLLSAAGSVGTMYMAMRNFQKRMLEKVGLK